jgi:hypothetical protein
MTLCGRFLLGGCGALRLHLATIESHRRVGGRAAGHFTPVFCTDPF